MIHVDEETRILVTKHFDLEGWRSSGGQLRCVQTADDSIQGWHASDLAGQDTVQRRSNSAYEGHKILESIRSGANQDDREVAGEVLIVENSANRP